jgi:hypothetical protein
MKKKPSPRKSGKDRDARSSGRKSRQPIGKKWPSINEDKIVSKAVGYYLSSGDFNGLPARSLLTTGVKIDEIRTILAHLLESGQLSLEFGARHPNPNVKALPPLPAAEQLAELATNDLEYACIYPTTTELERKVKRGDCQDRPFTRRLMLGEAQLEHHAFDLSVLEFYRNDPRYSYETNDVGGWISIRDEFFVENSHTHERDKVGLQTFGFGYNESFARAVVVFTWYLASLSPEHQQIWNAKRLDGRFELHPDYYRCAILGEWPTRLSIFEALTAELKHINEMARLMGKPALFRNEFADRPQGFTFLIRPTTKEFNDFVLLLDQMMSDNINKDFFRGDLALDTEAVRSDGKIVATSKGTIQLLEDWFKRMMRLSDPKPFDALVATFRRVRKLRQSPAHKVEDNAFNQELFKEQRQIVIEAYSAIRAIRLLLANHPKVREYKVPAMLFNGEIWDR